MKVTTAHKALAANLDDANRALASAKDHFASVPNEGYVSAEDALNNVASWRAEAQHAFDLACSVNHKSKAALIAALKLESLI